MPWLRLAFLVLLARPVARFFTGADVIGRGVASFSHVGGTHFQNEQNWGPYIERLNAGELPIYRLGAVLGTPTGPGTAAIAYVTAS